MLDIISFIIIIVIIGVSIPTVINRFLKLLFLFLSKKNKSNYQSKLKDFPPVAIHLAISNEEPEIVLKTISSLKNIDYPNYIVIVVDNNTNDRRLWEPIELFCKENQNKFCFYHIEKLSGYKAGALNYALDHTPKSFEFIAIVDADTVVCQDFLKKTIPYFQNEKIAIVQSPLGFSQDLSTTGFISWIFLVYRYYLSIYMPAANLFNLAPFIGAMGIVRRSALEKVGGWNGFYLTEDMELTFRLFKSGFSSQFINHSFGFGLLPTNWNNFIKQYYRWNFGNVQILRDYLRSDVFYKSNFKLDLTKWLIYFTCTSVYINIYLIPFIFISFFILITGFFNYSLKWIDLSCMVMLIVIITEIIGDIIMFITLGRREKASFINQVKNLMAWWLLSLSNSISTYDAILHHTKPFKITKKYISKYN